MKVHATCECGAELDVRACARPTLNALAAWQTLHAECIGSSLVWEVTTETQTPCQQGTAGGGTDEV